MDIINHGTQGFILGYVCTNNIPVAVVSSLTAVIPDLYGELKNDNYVWYNRVHNFKHWLSYIPPITLHIALDKLGHGEGKRWYCGKWFEYFMPWKWKEAMYLESLTWLINITILLWLFV